MGKKEFSVVMCGGQSSFLILFCLKWVSEAKSVCVSQCLCLYLGEKWVRFSKTKECLERSAVQHPRKVGRHCFFWHVLYVSKEQPLLAKNKRSQKSGSKVSR